MSEASRSIFVRGLVGETPTLQRAVKPVAEIA